MKHLPTSQLKVGFIGSGNMAQSMGIGLLQQGFKISQLMFSSPSRGNHPLLNDNKMTCTKENRLLVQSSDVIILATKPQQITQALDNLKQEFIGKCLISIAAGITTDKLQKMVANDCAVIRAMPNTPALIGEGMSGIYANKTARENYGHIVEKIFSAIGEWVWIDDEKLMDVVTAISGSGPAYFFHLLEALVFAAKKQGLDEDIALKLSIQTMKGAAALLKNRMRTPTELKTAVTSPAGTTAAALESLHQDNFMQVINNAVNAATQRGRQLAAQNESPC